MGVEVEGGAIVVGATVVGTTVEAEEGGGGGGSAEPSQENTAGPITNISDCDIQVSRKTKRKYQEQCNSSVSGKC